MLMRTIALAAGVGAALCLSAPIHTQEHNTSRLLSSVDHVVYATPDLNEAIASVERLLGVHPVNGGQHLGRGTRNALVALGPASYLEIIGPDPEQPRPAAPRPFGIDTLQHPRIAAWATKTADVAAVVRLAAASGITLGPPTPGSRRRPDGVELTWEYTDPRVVVGDGVMPFFINWGRSPHPAVTATRGASLEGLRGEHPRPGEIQQMLNALHVDLPVTQGTEPALIATISGRGGRVELR
jgi:catechol 2,3-dioxygenase-like lactoylglutathione lyase family enzyme